MPSIFFCGFATVHAYALVSWSSVVDALKDQDMHRHALRGKQLFTLGLQRDFSAACPLI